MLLASATSWFSHHRSMHQLIEDIVILVDEHTEYFCSHLEAIASKERKIYLALIDLWSPSTAKEIACYQECIKDFGQSTENEIQIQLAKAYLYQGIAWMKLKKQPEALTYSKKVIKHYNKTTEIELQVVVE